MVPPIRVLHLEDDARDAELLHELLKTGGVSADIVLVNSKARFEAALRAGSFDLVLSDYNIPDYDGIAAVKLVKEQRPETPVIVVSGSIGEEDAVKCLQVGATDYLLKERLDRLAPAVRRAIGGAEERRRHKEAEAKLRESEERLRISQAAGHWGVFEYNYQTGKNYWSPELEALYGLNAGEFSGTSEGWLERIHPEDRANAEQSAQLAIETGEYSGEYRVVWPDGSIRWIYSRGHVYRDERGQPWRMVGVNVDITERKQLEAQYRQAQKMESVGQLAGGIAHDFNNLLTVINGTAELALAQAPDGGQLHADLQEIRRAGERAASLTRQLLAFSRKQILQPQALDLNAVVAQMETMLQRLIGEDIDLVVTPAKGLGSVKADPGQIEQVIANLAVNARDAMPQGGKLTIETKAVVVDDDYARDHRVAAKPGPYVMLSISDTGIGMDEATRGRIFEPFFTTKDPGKGTGLGLSTVYGIVKQSDGFVWVYSEVGHGTTFQIHLPQIADVAGSMRRPSTTAPATGSETILLVEDLGGLRLLARRMLESAGYTVLTAASGEEAMLLLDRDEQPVDLMITDIVMPGMSGRALAERLQATRPAMKVLYISGYTDDVVVRHGMLDEGMPFLPKPFTAVELTRKVREVLTP